MRNSLTATYKTQGREAQVRLAFGWCNRVVRKPGLLFEVLECRGAIMISTDRGILVCLRWEYVPGPIRPFSSTDYAGVAPL